MRKKLLIEKNRLKLRRKRRIRGKISGTAQMPRVSVFKSNKFFYAQAIDDENGVTLAGLDGATKKVKSNIEGAKEAGKIFAATLKENSIEKVQFDRNGNQYHGVVAAFADALRENGITL